MLLMQDPQGALLAGPAGEDAHGAALQEAGHPAAAAGGAGAAEGAPFSAAMLDRKKLHVLLEQLHPHA